MFKKLYPFTRCLIAMNKRESIGSIDYYMIAIGVFLETLFLPLYPLVYKLHEHTHRKIKRGD